MDEILFGIIALTYLGGLFTGVGLCAAWDAISTLIVRIVAICRRTCHRCSPSTR